MSKYNKNQFVFKLNTGFTLIELMIVVAIVGLIASVAAPAYMSYAVEAERTQPITRLMEIVAEQERTYAEEGAYVKKPKSNREGQAVDLTAGTGNHTYSVTVGTSPSSFVATATNSSSSDPECNTYSISSTGQKTASNKKGKDKTAICWGL